MSGQKSYKTEQEIEQNISSELKQGIDELDTINDFKISDVLNTDLTKFVEQSSKNINQSIQVITQNYNLDISENSYIFNKLIDVCNKYNFERYQIVFESHL